MRPLRILQFGSSGQLSRALLAQASQPGATITALSRQEADFADPASVQRALEGVAADLVVNATAYTAVDKAESEPDLAFRVNGEAVEVLAQSCAALNLPLIHVSTDYVFDGTKPSAYQEDDPVAPLNVYGRSKAMGEAAITSAAGRHAILRTSWVYSATGSNFVKTMLALAPGRDELKIVADQHGAPTAAADLAAAILVCGDRLARDPDCGSGIFHVTGSGETSWAGFAEAVFELSGTPGRPRVLPIPTSEFPRPAVRPLNSRLDCSKFAAQFGWRAPHWRDSLEVVIRALQHPNQEQL
jgi:dTDP-4-dehydrorhamnose reductase